MSSGKQKKICQGCQVEISIGKYLEVQDNLFMHSRCFKCCDCGVEIGEKPFLPRGNGFACGDCVDRSKRTGSSTTTTTTTGSSSRSVSSHSDSPSSSSSPASSGDRKICAKCNDEILAVVFHNLHGKQYHTDCCRCCLCNGPCAKGIEENGKLYCRECVDKGFTKVCEKCKQVLNGGYMIALDKPYHPDCFTCHGCGIGLSGEQFYVSRDRPHCKACAEKNINS
mmetsp:Transcript_37996/g.52756  ORF Transcript_37996/g.52756 Transcript_37996/m.52756 type:complete len:224 (-) Transcript_37996:105-776(-)